MSGEALQEENGEEATHHRDPAVYIILQVGAVVWWVVGVVGGWRALVFRAKHCIGEGRRGGWSGSGWGGGGGVVEEGECVG